MKIEFYDKETGEAEQFQEHYFLDADLCVHRVIQLCYGEYLELGHSVGWRIIDQWQPIETAPKDGTDLLLSNGCALDYGFFCKDTNKFTTENPFFMPTHWMLQPPNPKDKE